MRSSRFHGTAIGGPLDGWSIVHDQPVYQAPERQARACLNRSREVVSRDFERIFTYVHEHLDLPGEPEPIFFWRLETETRREAIARVFFNYPRGTVRNTGGEPDHGS